MSIDSLQTSDDLEGTFEVPDKYKGKEATDLVKMHMDLEKDRSRLANEVGTLRQMADQLLGLQRTRDETLREARKPITTDDLLNNPEESLETAISANPEVAALRQESQILRKEVAQSKFEREFPDWQSDVNDTGFADWVKGNKVRQQLGINAQSGDYDSASSLWGLWKERKSDLAQISQTKNDLKKKAEKFGTLEGSGTSGLESDKIYSRVEMMDLHRRAIAGDPASKAKWNDPVFQAERMLAYEQKRVK